MTINRILIIIAVTIMVGGAILNIPIRFIIVAGLWAIGATIEESANEIKERI